MTWSWRFETNGGEVVSRESGRFPTQAEAEAWIGESWQELLGAGVDAVSLLEGDRVVYGPMSLHPAD